MNDLVRRLSEGEHPVEASLRPERTSRAFKEAIDRGYVHVRFTSTRGGTELGFYLNKELSDIAGANFEPPRGTVRLCGDLTLDYERVRCIAEIDVASLEGHGRLQILEGAPAADGA
jgi:hypothetical protein